MKFKINKSKNTFLIALAVLLVLRDFSFAGPKRDALKARQHLGSELDGQAKSTPSVVKPAAKADLETAIRVMREAIPEVRAKAQEIISQFKSAEYKDPTALGQGASLMKNAIQRVVTKVLESRLNQAGVGVEDKGSLSESDVAYIDQNSGLPALAQELQEIQDQAFTQKLIELVQKTLAGSAQDQDQLQEQGSDQESSGAPARFGPEQMKAKIDHAVEVDVADMRVVAQEAVGRFNQMDFKNELAVVEMASRLAGYIGKTGTENLIKRITAEGLIPEDITEQYKAYIENHPKITILNAEVTVMVDQAISEKVLELKARKDARARSASDSRPKSTLQRLQETNWSIPGF